MSKAKLPIVSEGHVIALWRLIHLTKRYKQLTVTEAVEIARNSSLLGGTFPVGLALSLGQQLTLLIIDAKRQMHASPYCIQHLHPLCDEEQPNRAATWGILQRILIYEKAGWLLFYNEDAEVFKSSIPDSWIGLLEGAGLFSFHEIDVQQWWITVFGSFKKYQEGRKLDQGKMVENLTMDFEYDRLRKDGVRSPELIVKWASEVSDSFGYDVVSIRGTLLKLHYHEKQQLKIEVKSSAASTLESFRFLVSRNEWLVAKADLENYYFYCWTTANLERKTATGPFIIAASSIREFIPQDNNPQGEWTECRVTVDLEGIRVV